MSTHKSPVLAILILCFLNGIAFPQAWSGILHPSRAVDWSQAGSAHINDSRTQCVTSQCSTVSGGEVTAASINAALSSAPANSYVLIPPGIYTMTAGITFHGKSNITLRGSGSNSTFLVFTGSGASDNCSGHDICASSSDTSYWGGPSNSANWIGTNGSSGTYSRGATSIILSSVNNLAVGEPIILDQLDDASDNGGLWVGCEVQNSRCGNDGPSGFQRVSNGTPRGQQQIVNVTSISGSGPYTVGITPGIYGSNWRTSQSPGAWWATNPVFNDGVESMSIDNSSGGDAGVVFANCTGCWVKAVSSITTKSKSGSGWGEVKLVMCNHCTVRDSYFYGVLNTDNYVVAVDLASDLLVENNIMQYPSPFQFYNSDCEGCVSGYNFSAGTLYGAGTENWMATPAMFHSVNLFSLGEGNIGTGFWADGYHGTHVLNTQFRNRFDGRQPNGTTQVTSNTYAIQLAPGARYMNFIGNILGTPGYHTTYLTQAPASAISTAVILAGIFPGTGVSNDTLSYPTTMWWGNWDADSNAARWCGSPSNPGWTTVCGSTSEVPSTGLPNGNAYANPIPAKTNLPASFYMNAKPSWWPSGKDWPAIGPDVSGGNVGQCSGGTYANSEATSLLQCTGGSFTPVARGMVTSSPAMDCYLNVMGGLPNGARGPLKFDASVCYSSGVSRVDPPQNLQATVQ